MSSRTAEAAVAVAVAAAACGALLQYGIHEHPVFNDRAYFLCLGQLVLSGESVYANTFLGYPPMGPLLAGAAMALGDGFGVPTWLSARYAALALAGLNAALVFLVTRRATNRAGAGIVAAITLTSFSWYGAVSVSSLEPKTAIIALTLLTCLAVQRGSPLWTGLWSGLAPLCWQPAGVVTIAGWMVIAWRGRSRPVATARGLALGLALAAVPSVLYLTLLSAWGDFADRLFGIHVGMQFGGEIRPWHWLRSSWRLYGTERALLVASGTGLALFAVSTLWDGRRVLTRWLDPVLGGMPLVALGWLAYVTVDFQGYPDLFPLLPVIAFFCGWLADRGVAAVAAVADRSGVLRASRALPPALFTVIAVVAAQYGLEDAFRYEADATLAQQRAVVDDISRAGMVVSFGADSVYALSDRRSPLPFLRLTNTFARQLGLVQPGGCAGLFQRIVALKPGAIVVPASSTGECVTMIEVKAAAAGYHSSLVKWYAPVHGELGSESGGLDRIDWRVYRAPR